MITTMMLKLFFRTSDEGTVDTVIEYIIKKKHYVLDPIDNNLEYIYEGEEYEYTVKNIKDVLCREDLTYTIQLYEIRIDDIS